MTPSPEKLRYTVHELLRQYADAELHKDADLATRIDEAHAAFFASVAKESLAFTTSPTGMRGRLHDLDRRAAVENRAPLREVDRGIHYRASRSEGSGPGLSPRPRCASPGPPARLGPLWSAGSTAVLASTRATPYAAWSAAESALEASLHTVETQPTLVLLRCRPERLAARPVRSSPLPDLPLIAVGRLRAVVAFALAIEP
jgi:hypothetical protein